MALFLVFIIRLFGKSVKDVVMVTRLASFFSLFWESENTR